MTFSIRQERADDLEAALAVERAAFGSDEEASIVEVVRSEEGSFALVAESDGEIVGHVQLTRAWIGGTAVVALGPIGVAPDRQGRGIGAALVRAAVAVAAGRGVPAVIVLGDPGWYARFGFRPGAGLGLRNPYAGVEPGGFEIHEEDFMLAVVDPGMALSGPVRWHAAFGEPRA